MTLSVVPIYEINVRDITSMLRKLADDIEAGVYGDIAGVVTVIRRADYAVEIFGHGEENYDTTIVALELGKLKLLRMSP